MPTLEQIRDAIKAKVETVSDTGNVHTYERFSVRISELKNLYLFEDEIRGWNIQRVETSEVAPHLGRWIIDHLWQIRGYMSLDDSAASEKTFDLLIEQIRDAFRSDETLGDVITTSIFEDIAGVQVIEYGPVEFAGILCHAAVLRLRTRHLQ